jgi:DNA-directed RNA polymerase specialized sigma24 family protein
MAAAESKPSRAAEVLRRIPAKADAADLAQEVYLRMLRVSDSMFV